MRIVTCEISVIIPTLNEAETLAETLESIGTHSDTEIILVDGGSRDATAERGSQLGCRVLFTAAGRGSQLVAGAHAARGRWLWFVHADTRVPADWRELLWRPRIPVACLRLGIAGRHPGLRLIELGAQARTAWDGIAYGDQTLWITRSVYDSVGGHPPWPLFEDVGLGERLVAAGHAPARLHARVQTSARRWQHDGMLARTLRNWQLRWRYAQGADPRIMARSY